MTCDNDAIFEISIPARKQAVQIYHTFENLW